MRMAYMDRRAAGNERRPTAGRNRGLGLWRVSLNCDVTPAVWLTRADGYKQFRRRAVWQLVYIHFSSSSALSQTTN